MTHSITARYGWTLSDSADYFDVLTEWTAGMSHPDRVAWLANELNLWGDDEQLTDSKALAWVIIEAWEAENARLDAYARASVERQWEMAK